MLGYISSHVYPLGCVLMKNFSYFAAVAGLLTYASESCQAGYRHRSSKVEH